MADYTLNKLNADKPSMLIGNNSQKIGRLFTLGATMLMTIAAAQPGIAGVGVDV